MHVCALSHFSCVWLFVTPWTGAHQAPLSMGFSRQEYQSGFPCPPAWDLPSPSLEPSPLTSPALAGRFFKSATWEPMYVYIPYLLYLFICWWTLRLLLYLGNWQLYVVSLQCSCLENPGDGRAWWAAVCGAAQYRTRLKWLSSSSGSRHKKWNFWFQGCGH